MPFPIELDVRNRRALFIGESPEALGKIERLMASGARVDVVSEQPSAAIEELAKLQRITLQRRAFRDGDLAGAFLVFLAPGAPDLAMRLHAEAVRAGRLFCSLDRPETCTFTNVAIVDAGGLTLTASTGGSSPGTARRIREDLESLFGDPRFSRFLATLRAAREKLPMGKRAASMAEAVKGFAVEARLRFPEWFERGEDPPGGGGS